MISSTMTPSQISTTLARLKRALDDPVTPQPKRQKVRRSRRKAQTALLTTAGNSASVRTQSNAVVPRAITTTSNNGSLVRIANTEVWNSTWPIGEGDTFGVTGAYINPVAKLAWAGSIAINFSKYRFTKLTFHYRPTVGTTTAGYYAMAFATDPEDATGVENLTASNTLPRLANSRRYVQVPVWQEAALDIKPADFSQGWYLVEANTISDQSTARQCTAGAFFQAALVSDGAPTGVLYVEYVLELMDPVNSLVNR
jgi:hypothetical protein